MRDRRQEMATARILSPLPTQLRARLPWTRSSLSGGSLGDRPVPVGTGAMAQAQACLTGARSVSESTELISF